MFIEAADPNVCVHLRNLASFIPQKLQSLKRIYVDLDNPITRDWYASLHEAYSRMLIELVFYYQPDDTPYYGGATEDDSDEGEPDLDGTEFQEEGWEL